MAEAAIQKQVFAEIKSRGMPGIFAFHVPNHKGARRAAGFVAGIPDVIAIKDGIFYGLELKAGKNKPSEDQDEVIARINEAGGFACACTGLERALACLEMWGILRREV